MYIYIYKLRNQVLPGPLYVDHHEAVSHQDVTTDLFGSRHKRSVYHHCVLES